MAALASILLAVAAAPQGSLADLLDPVREPAWLLREVEQGEHLEVVRWGPAAADRSVALDGPGLLARITATPPAGRLAFYGPEGADGGEPLFVWDLAEAATESSSGPFVAPLAMRIGETWTAAVPVPFRAGLTVVHEPDPAQPAEVLLEFQRRATDAGLPELSADLYRGASARWLRRWTARLAAREPVAVAHDGFKAGRISHSGIPFPDGLADNGDLRWYFHGSGVVQWLELAVLSMPPVPIEEFMNGLVLRMEEDVEAVEKPGTVLFEVPLAGLVGCEVNATKADGLRGRADREMGVFRVVLPIPFRDGMKLVLASPFAGETGVRLACGVDPLPAEEVPPYRLHAAWRGSRGMVGPLPPLTISGPARIVGWSLSAVGADPSPWSVGGASAFAAGADRSGSGLTVGLPVFEGPGGYGRSAWHRDYLYDAPVATEELEFSTGVGFAAPSDWSAVVWWYGPPDSQSDWGPLASWEERRLGAPPEALFQQVDGALEGERLRIANQSRGTRVQIIQGTEAEGCSALRWLRWSGGRENAQCNLEFPVMEAAEYRILVRPVAAPDHGRLQVLVRRQAPRRTDRAAGGGAPAVGRDRPRRGAHAAATGPHPVLAHRRWRRVGLGLSAPREDRGGRKR